MRLHTSRDAVMNLLVSNRHKLVWGCDDEKRLGLPIRSPITGACVGGLCECIFTFGSIDVQKMFGGSSLKQVSAFFMGVKAGRYASPHHSFYNAFNYPKGQLNKMHASYCCADVLFTLAAFLQKKGATLYPPLTMQQLTLCLPQ